jgi:hypothetical protein
VPPTVASVRAEADPPTFEGLSPSAAFGVGPLRLWLTHPLGMATQFAPNAHLSVSLSRLIAGPATEALLALHRKEPRPLRFVHDWRNLMSYDSEARLVLTEWALSLGSSRVLRVDVLLGPRTPSFVRMGTAVGQAALAVAGMTLRVHYESSVFARASEASLLRPHPGWRPGSQGAS